MSTCCILLEIIMKILLTLILSSLLSTFSNSSYAGGSQCFLPPHLCQNPPSETIQKTKKTSFDEAVLAATLNTTPDTASPVMSNIPNEQWVINRVTSNKTTTKKTIKIMESR